MLLRKEDWRLFIYLLFKSQISVYSRSSPKFSSARHAAEMGLAHSSLVKSGTTRMQMSYKAIHLLYMPP